MGLNKFPPPQFPWDVPGTEYRLIRLLGEGGQGVAYEAQSRPNRTLRRAIKFINRPEGKDSAQWVNLFWEEAGFGQGVRSDFLGHTLERFRLDEYGHLDWPPVALVMELFDTTLEKVLRECREKGHKLPFRTVERWLQGLCVKRQLFLPRDDNQISCSPDRGAGA